MSGQNYQDFLKQKSIVNYNSGFIIDKNKLHKSLFEYQKDVIAWAVKKGRCAIFLDTGLGKTFVQLEFARIIDKNTLIIAPLSVARQTAREAKKLDMEIKYVRSGSEISNKISITNYEMLDNFDIDKFECVILDESSILKSIGGKYKRKLIDKCKNVKYKMACTATPAPNDNTEIGNHAEFLGICKHSEMLARFFVNANKEHTTIINDFIHIRKGSNKHGTEWRLKHHAENMFYEWLSSWAICFTDPHDLGYEYDYKLPKLNIIKHVVKNKEFIANPGELFFTGLHGLKDRVDIKRQTISEKLEKLKEILKDEQTIIWCNLVDECKAIKKVIDCVEVQGKNPPEYKTQMFEDFQDGKFNYLMTKGKIGGFGMNFQNAHNMIFFSLNDSWETFYQCIRRQWRYGQNHPVNVHIIITDYEMEIYKNIMRKDAQAKRLKKGLIEHVKDYEKKELNMEHANYKEELKTSITEGSNFKAIQGDSCIELPKLEKGSIDLSVYSPPFADLYTYSDSNHDLGNSANAEEFYKHYTFIVKDLLRLTKPGRLSCVHCMDIPALAQKDGYIGVKDFPGDLIRMHIEAGWIFYGRCFIQKNPQAQAIRTHSKALLFVQLRRDSASSRPALVDQVLIFQKPGDNKTPITPVDNNELDNETWISWANGIWNDISESDTLQFYEARAERDEKHICPLQLGTIERCIKLYSNPGETVCDPFSGIGSTLFQAIKFNRKGIGIELKESYYNISIKNLRSAEDQFNVDMFKEVKPCLVKKDKN